jgi:hypothetical protein
MIMTLYSLNSDCDILLWICMYCLKWYLLYFIIIVLRTTGKISLLLLTVVPSWNKVISYLLYISINKMTSAEVKQLFIDRKYLKKKAKKQHSCGCRPTVIIENRYSTDLQITEGLRWREIWFDWFDFIVCSATFRNISAISWWPVLVVEEAGENHRPWASNW